MKRTILVLSLIAAGAVSAGAQTWRGPHSDYNLERRIEQGVRTGQLTRGEAFRLRGDLDRLHAFLEERSRGSLQHIGMVRFNPFEDTGSDQSFAIALLDDRRDGVVLSSLHGRANTRLFAKPVENGASKHALSTEEAQAIRIAVEGTRPAPTAQS